MVIGQAVPSIGSRINVHEGQMPVSIAIIEDQKDIVDLYKTVIEANGMRINFIAYDGLEGVRAYKNTVQKPDIILIDQRMEVMAGLETMKEILSISPGAGFIFISASEEVKDEILAAGARAFIKKPASLKEVLDAISAALKAGRTI